MNGEAKQGVYRLNCFSFLWQAGFGCGLTLMVIMAGLMLYMAYRIMTSTKSCSEIYYICSLQCFNAVGWAT